MGDWLYLIIAIAVVGVLTLAGLLTSGRRRKAAPPSGTTDVIVPSPTETETATEAPPEPAVDTAGAVATEPAVEEPPAVERPESTASRLVRLRQRLSRSQGGLGKGLLALLSRERLDEDTWEAIEDTLLTADVGVAPTQALVDKLRTRLRVEGGQAPDPRTVLREELIELVGTDLDRRVQVTGADGKPGVVLVVGVNGAGKTTTVGKIARILVAEDLTVTLGAADTFRAAAVDQLATWGERVGVEVVRGPEGGDPASVAFEAVKHGVENGVDTVLVDTASRTRPA
jgi:fused signal recognition particle receptor